VDALTRIGWALFSGAVAASFVTALSIAIAAPRVWPGAVLSGITTFASTLIFTRPRDDR